MTSSYEIATNENVPAIRSYLAKRLVKDYKMSEKDAAAILEVAQAAISKYVSGKYSDKVKKVEQKINKQIVDAYIEKIAEGKKEYVSACICKSCQSIRQFDCAFSSAESVKV